MTWQDYVHVLLMESGNVARAAIHGTKDGQLLGCTEDLCLSPEQVRGISWLTIIFITYLISKTHMYYLSLIELLPRNYSTTYHTHYHNNYNVTLRL